MTEKLPPTLLAEQTTTASSARAEQASHPKRYEDLGRIAAGASGEVRRVRDLVLDRVLAMKVLRWEHVDSARMRARFNAEAQVTAGLQHPGIVAVHDRGELADGRLWFTMKEVNGRTLREVIEEVHAASGPDGFRTAPSGWTFRRLVDALVRIGHAVGYAHSRGVIHRDLKPENLMVGEFGEVLVMDWGLARRAGDHADPPGKAADPREPPAAVIGPDHPHVSDKLEVNATLEIESESQREPKLAIEIEWTRHGDILGTPAYMSPEQAHGLPDLHGPPSDVYQLGAILYHLLTGRPPYDGDGLGVWRQVIAGPPPSIEEAARGGPPVPEELAAIAARAMQRAIPDRYPDAATLAGEVLTWLDGARRREQALAILDDASTLAPPIADLRAQAALAQAEARALLNVVRPSDPVEKKRPAWELEREAARLARQAAILEADWLQRVHGALSQAPDLLEAHAALADHYRERLTAAEIAHQDEDAARFEVLLAAHDRGRHEAFLRGNAALTLVTDPAGAEVSLSRYTLVDHRLAPEHVAELGQTPLLEVPLARGSYLLHVRAPGRAEVRYPVLLERDGHWDGRAPGGAAPHAILLPPDGELGEDDVYVPAGFAWTGGDGDAIESLPRRRIWIDGFVIRRFPVTNREFLEFLNDLVASGREAEALASCPRPQAGQGHNEPLVERDGRGLFVLRAGGSEPSLEPDWPVVLVSWRAASAYASWLAERTGKPWRLPNDVEREKAARGVDGRIFPWGDHAEATYPCVAENHANDPHRSPVDGYPGDESPYGARGLAGNARDWCINVWRSEGPPVVEGRLTIAPAAADDEDYRSVRGGAWLSPISYSRAAGRFGSRPAFRHLTTGFRVARSYPGDR